MDLLQRILNCKDEEVDEIIDVAIQQANANSEKVERLGFQIMVNQIMFLRDLFLWILE